MGLSLTRNRLLAAVAASVVFAASGSFADEDHATKEAWRLFVADHTNPVVRVIDFEDGKELGRYDVKGYASLTASASGQTVFAGQTEADVIHVIKTGINFSDHGEHRDLEVSEPALLPVTFEGKRPGHVVPHDDHVVLFYDRTDKAEIVDEAEILDGKVEPGAAASRFDPALSRFMVYAPVVNDLTPPPPDACPFRFIQSVA